MKSSTQELDKEKSTEALNKSVERHELWKLLSWGLNSTLVSLLVFFSSAYSHLSQGSELLFTYFAVGISGFAIIIVGVASLMRHADREVIVLKRRLAGIYLSALEKSAFNPQIKYTSPDD